MHENSRRNKKRKVCHLSRVLIHGKHPESRASNPPILKIFPDRQEPSSEEMHLLGRELIASHFAENLGLVKRVAVTDRTDLTQDWKIVRSDYICHF
jgi:hypothetical protein